MKFMLISSIAESGVKHHLDNTFHDYLQALKAVRSSKETITTKTTVNLFQDMTLKTDHRPLKTKQSHCKRGNIIPTAPSLNAIIFPMEPCFMSPAAFHCRRRLRPEDFADRAPAVPARAILLSTAAGRSSPVTDGLARSPGR